MPLTEKNRPRLKRKVTTRAENRGRSHADQHGGFGTEVHERFAAIDSNGLTLPERIEQPRIVDLPK